jgi:hypothetical protein
VILPKGEFMQSRQSLLAGIAGAVVVASVFAAFMLKPRSASTAMEAVRQSERNEIFAQNAIEVGESVIQQLDLAGWSAGDAGAIAMACEVSVPVLGGYGVDDYFSFVDELGLPGDEARTRERFEVKANSSKWNELADRGVVPPATSQLSAKDMHRLLVHATRDLYAVRIKSVDASSARVVESTNVNLNDGERYVMTSALSSQWQREQGNGGAVSVELQATLSDGRPARVHLLIAQTRVGDKLVWAPAACAVISTGTAQLPFIAF